MTLLHATFLIAGIAAAAIPVLIHFLFRRRRPPFDWAAMEILLAALRRQERRLRLEQLLLLAARCLLFALAGLALARPLVEGVGLLSSGRRTVIVLVDDGAASAVRTDPADPSTSAFERLRHDAVTLVRSLDAGDKVGVVLASKPAHALVLPATADREAVARALESLEPSSSASDLSGALLLAGGEATREPDGEHVVAVLSEFRLGSLDVAGAKPIALAGAERGLRLLASAPSDEDCPDVAVAAIEPQRSVDDDSITVAVRVDRAGGTLPSQTVRVSLDGDGLAPMAAKTVRFDAGQANARVEFVARASADAPRAGTGALRASIGGDRMPLDDERFAIFDARGATRVVIVGRRGVNAGAEIERVPASRWLLRALEPVEQPGVEVAETDPAALDAKSLRQIDALFVPRPETLAADLWPALRTFVDRGGFLVLMPSTDSESQRWTDRFHQTFGQPPSTGDESTRAAAGLQWQVSADAAPLAAPLTFAADQPQSGLFTAVEAELTDLLRPIEVTRRVEVHGAAPADVALVLSDGSPFLLLAAPSGPGGAARGMVALLTSAPELGWTNLPVKPFMVPFAQEILRRGLGRIGRADRITVGERPSVNVRDAMELAAPSDVPGALRGSHIALDSSGVPAAPLNAIGPWAALDGTSRIVGAVAVNVDALAARTTPQSRDVVSQWLSAAAPVTFVESGGLARMLAPSDDHVSIAMWILMAVAAIAVVETWMARRFSHAAITRGSAGDPGVTPSALMMTRGEAA